MASIATAYDNYQEPSEGIKLNPEPAPLSEGYSDNSRSIFISYSNRELSDSDSAANTSGNHVKKYIFAKKPTETPEITQRSREDFYPQNEKLNKVSGHIIADTGDFVTCKIKISDIESVEINLAKGLFSPPSNIAYGASFDLHIDKSSGFRTPVISRLSFEEAETPESIEANKILASWPDLN